MTREERENAIRHINSALDVDDWAKERAAEALSEDWDAIIKQMRALYEDCMNGAAGEYTRGWDNAIDACIAIMKGGER